MMTMMLVQKGMDTVFKIWDATTNTETSILKNWGKVTMVKTQAWVRLLSEILGDKFDCENLRMSGLGVRDSLGPKLLNRVLTLFGITATGPELFLAAVHQVFL